MGEVGIDASILLLICLHSRGMFGEGLYTSSTSSKSDDYASNTGKSSSKAMLLNKVVVGNGCKMTENSDKLTSPPPGYDSASDKNSLVLRFACRLTASS